MHDAAADLLYMRVASAPVNLHSAPIQVSAKISKVFPRGATCMRDVKAVAERACRLGLPASHIICSSMLGGRDGPLFSV